MKKIIAFGLALMFLAIAVAVPMTCPNGAVNENGEHSNTLLGDRVSIVNAYGSEEIRNYILAIDNDEATDISLNTGCTQLPAHISGDKTKIYTVKYTMETTENNGRDVLLNSSSLATTVFPGALLKGDSNVANNTPNQISLNRTDLAYSTTLEVSPSGFTANPTNYSDVKDGITSVVNRWKTDGSALPAKWNYSYSAAESQQQLCVDLDVAIPQLADLGIGYQWQSSDQETSYVIKYTQIYYTVGITTSSDPSTYFASDVTKEQVKHAFGNDKADTTQAVIVTSVSYGSSVYAKLTTKNTTNDAKIALEAAICDTEESLSVEQQKILNNTTLEITVDGGDSPGTSAKTMDELRDFLLSHTEVTKDNITKASPVQYTTRWIDSNNTACSNTTSTYNKKTVIETCSVEYSYYFNGGYVGNGVLRYYTFDGMNADGTYINERPVEIKFEDYCCGFSNVVTIPAYHKPYMYLTCSAVSEGNVITDLEVCPLYKLHYDHGGTVCYQDIYVYVDDEMVYKHE